MKKILLISSILLVFITSYAQKLTPEEDALAEMLMTRKLTKKEQSILDNYMNKKFVNENVFIADLKKVILEGLYIPTEYEADCAGRLIGNARKDKYNLRNKTYEEIWDGARNFCIEYVDSHRENKALKVDENNQQLFNNKTFTQKDVFISDIKKYNSLYSEKQIKCAILFIDQALAGNYNISKNTYQEIFENGGALCGE